MNEKIHVDEAFPIVAVGASAGGLAPTLELLQELGDEPGIAVVIIHHLDPTHESGLADVLSRATPLPLTLASDRLRIARNHVYVIPQNAGMFIAQGVLRVVPRPAHGLHLPIDQFFESLALDLDGLAAAVVLSGTGADGTEGVKAIKREGGITLAQDDSAQYGNMPESAIATGCVDASLPPAGIARELRRLGAEKPALRMALQAGVEGREYPQILAAVRKGTGVDFTSYKHSTIRRRLERRLFFRGVADLRAYLELLSSDPSEIAALCEEALIHVTGFFRDLAAFDALRTEVFPKICEGRQRDRPIRIWVPGCSSGEEVYSIAIGLLEALEELHCDAPIKIFGTDLSTAVIEQARAARFTTSIENELAEARIRRFFTKTPDGYKIRRDVRDLCVFATHDVTRDPPFATMDLISCRNLMIYLNPDLQERVISLLHYALNEPGYLLLGSAETARASAGFVAVDGKNKIYARTSAAPRIAFDFTTPRGHPERPLVGPGPADLPSTLVRSGLPGSSEVQREADRLVLAAYAPPGVVVTNDLAIIQFRGHTGLFLEHAPGVASLDLLRTVREELKLPLRQAIDQARSSNSAVRRPDVVFSVGDTRHLVDIEIIPFAVHVTRQRYLLVLFRDTTHQADSAAQLPAAPASASSTEAGAALEQELTSTRQYLESVIEQLEATNEELKAANDEVVSSNEELQSAKEELQATNEELRTVNDEMGERSAAAIRLSDDLANALSSIEVPIFLVERNLRLRRYTPAAARVFGLLPTDLGRPVAEILSIIAVAPTIVSDLQEVVERLRPAQNNVQDASGHWYDLSVRPYLTIDGRVDGSVVVARDIHAERESVEALEEALAYAQSVVDTVRECLVVVDGARRITSANAAFLVTFNLTQNEILGRCLHELGRPELATPSLTKLLGTIATAPVDSLPLERSEIGEGRSFLLSVRRIADSERLLLSFENVTQIQEYREQLRRMAFEAAASEERERRRVAVALHDHTGQALALAQMKLTTVRGELTGEARVAVDRAVQLLEQATADARALIFDLSPPILYDLGLVEALAWLAEDFEQRYGLSIDVVHDGIDIPLDDVVKGVIFRAVRELLMNVLKHAGTSSAALRLSRRDDEMHVEVEDRGNGFEPVSVLGIRSDRGMGLVSVRAQLARFGGLVEVSSQPGRGTCLSIRIPLKSNGNPASGEAPPESERPS